MRHYSSVPEIAEAQYEAYMQSKEQRTVAIRHRMHSLLNFIKSLPSACAYAIHR
jgi:hypothetical protein